MNLRAEISVAGARFVQERGQVVEVAFQCCFE
jgi:hypothetical protein